MKVQRLAIWYDPVGNIHPPLVVALVIRFGEGSRP